MIQIKWEKTRANSDGIKKSRLETMVFMVNEITHSFSNGQFSQTLSLVKFPWHLLLHEFKPYIWW